MKHRSVLTLLFFVILSIPAYGQINPQTNSKAKAAATFTIQGHLAGYTSPAQITLRTFDQGQKKQLFDTVSLKEERFVLKGKITTPLMVKLTLIDSTGDDYNSQWFFIAPGRIGLSIPADSIDTFLAAQPMITGSAINTDYFKEYLPYISAAQQAIDDWYNDYEKKFAALENNSHLRDSATHQLRLLTRTLTARTADYALAHPDSYVSLYTLYDRFWRHGYNVQVEQAFQQLSSRIKKNDFAASFRKKLLAASRFAPGKIFPATSLYDTNGNTSVLYNRKDKQHYILLEFWFHNCGPCINQFNMLKTIYTPAVSRQLTIINISTDKKKYQAALQAAIKKHELLWPQFWDMDGKLAAQAGINRFPYNFLLSGDGRILQIDISMFELKQLLGLQ
jgi:peroxiredoxin